MEEKMNYTAYLKDLCEEFIENNKIDPSVYSNLKIKRGLRNADGTGVLAGITNIGNVHGYLLNEGELMPVPGELIYRGVNVNDIVYAAIAEDRFAFEETAYLLLFGKLPNSAELDSFKEYLSQERDLPSRFTEEVLITSPSPNIMNKLQQAILSLYAYDQNPDDQSLENVMRQSLQLIAQFPTIITRAYQVKEYRYNNVALSINPNKSGLSSAESILNALRPGGGYTDLEAKILDLALVLHAEHGGGNNSAFACRVLSSSSTDTYSAISAAIGSLKGAKHGGANAKVREMFDFAKTSIKNWNNDDEILDFLTKLLRKEAGDKSGLIYGIGHAIYTVSDPRAIILRDCAKDLAAQKNREDEFGLLFNIERLAPIAFCNFKNTTQKICANVDLYTGLIYEMLGLPTDLYTPLFAMSRIVGWSAHRMEEILTGGKIIRPAYKAVSRDVPYIPLKDRT